MLDNMRNTEYYTSKDYGTQQTNTRSITKIYHSKRVMSREKQWIFRNGDVCDGRHVCLLVR